MSLFVQCACLIVLVLAVIKCSGDRRRECESRRCPSGMTAQLLDRQGCLCVVRPK